MGRSNQTVEVVPVELPDALRYLRNEARMSIALAARLTALSGERIPALLADLSPTGVMVVVDRRFSPLVPVPVGTTMWIEFYFDEVEVTGATVKVRGCKARDRFQYEIGYAFVDLSDRARTTIRSKVAASKIARRR